MNRYTVSFSTGAKADLDRIAKHLFDSYRSFGASPQEAFDKSDTRIFEIMDFVNGLEHTPHRGTTHDEIRADLRVVSDGRRAQVAFRIDESTQTVRVLRLFYGAEDYLDKLMGF